MCLNLLKMQNKKSQIQMGESIAIIFIFFVLLIFGFVFYMNVMRSSAKVEIEENIQLKAIGIAQKASFLPELQCSEENVRTENCIDLLKLEAAYDMIKSNNIYYYDIFESSKIYIDNIFPGVTDSRERQDICPADYDQEKWPKCLYNNPLDEYSNKLSTFIPISLYDSKEKTYSFGILVVEVYRK